MTKRYMVLGLSVFLAIALAVPAFGGPTNPLASISSSAKGIANKALKKAKAAEKTANTALSTANTANSAAGAAQTSANNAQTTANSAKALAEAAQKSAEAANANANERIARTEEVFGTANPATGFNTETNKEASAECGAGKLVLGGGFFVNGEGEKVTVTDSNPALIYGNGWVVEGSAISGTPSWSIQADVICGVK